MIIKVWDVGEASAIAELSTHRDGGTTDLVADQRRHRTLDFLWTVEADILGDDREGTFPGSIVAVKVAYSYNLLDASPGAGYRHIADFALGPGDRVHEQRDPLPRGRREARFTAYSGYDTETHYYVVKVQYAWQEWNELSGQADSPFYSAFGFLTFYPNGEIVASGEGKDALESAQPHVAVTETFTDHPPCRERPGTEHSADPADRRAWRRAGRWSPPHGDPGAG